MSARFNVRNGGALPPIPRTHRLVGNSEGAEGEQERAPHDDQDDDHPKPKMTMRAPLPFVAFLLFPVLLNAQLPDPASLRARAKGMVDTLASPEFHGRGYVLNGGGIAADWIEGRFKKIGLEPLKETYTEPFTFDVNTFPEPVRFSVEGKALRPGVDFLVDPASGKAEGTYDLVHLTMDDLLTPERRRITLSVVVNKAMILEFPRTSNADSLKLYAEWEDEMVNYGPVIRVNHGKLTWSVARHALPNAVVEVLPGLVSDSAATVDLSVKNAFVRQYKARNVWGVVKAKSKTKDWVLVTAHYDHLGHMGPDVLFPGANDNASGVSMLITLAEWFKKHPAKVNLLFVAFAGEEAGLVGSEWFVVDRPMDLSTIKQVVNLDLNGTGEEGITVVNAVEQKATFDQLVAINAKSQRLPQVKPRGPACNSDHCSFTKRGIPGIFIYTMGGISAYHDVNDKPETLPLTEFGDLALDLIELVQGLK